MREKNYNTGLRGVLFEERHYAQMGSALWLYGWLVLRQTHQSGQLGWVRRGAPINYREIEEETGFMHKTLEQLKTTSPSGSGEGENRKTNPIRVWPQYQEQNFFNETRRRHNLLRPERDEAVRRELAVGTGPEVRGR